MHKKFPFIILFGLAAVAAVTTIVMVVWNYVIPAIFKLPEINFWQTLALIFLSKIFFSSFHGRGGRDFPWGRKRREDIHRRFEEKLSSMSPEDRELFMEARSHFGRRWKRKFDWNDREDSSGKKAADKKEDSEKGSSDHKE